MALLLVALLPRVSQAQLRIQEIASGLAAPVAFVADPVYSNTFYIVEVGGLVKVWSNGQVQAVPFIDLRGAISTGGERGLLGMAFSPDAGSGRVFFNFTAPDGHTVVARFQRTGGAPFRADPGSRFDLQWPSGERFIRQPFANHNGGHLEFGPDGYLYIGLGDGGSGNDPNNLAQNPASLLGKMLRIDVSVGDSDPVGYRVPASNPFVDGHPIAALAEIWSFGLRNPWRYSFDNFGAGATGALIIGDVGQGAREEVNIEPFGAGGRNYGWRIREGGIATPGVPPTVPAYGPLVEPVFDYAHPVGRAVTGGYIYRGTALGAIYRGRYFFADYVTSRLWSMGMAFAGNGEAIVTDVAEHTGEIGGNLGGIASFGRDYAGELYLVTFAGRVLKIVSDAGPAAGPQNLAATVIGQTVTLSWVAPVGGSIGAYQLEAGSSAGAANLAIATTAATAMTFSNVPAGTYYVRVRGTGPSGPGSPSNEVIVVVGASGGCPLPPAPGSFVATITGRTVTLLWTQGGSSPTHFVIEAGSSAGLANLAILTVPIGTSSLTVQAPPGVYYARVRAVSACGTGAPSNEIIVTVL
jgi:glucose/arabinose dehydrogenase